MGLDAIVRCTCFAQGLTSPPPVPITLDERGLPNFDRMPRAASRITSGTFHGWSLVVTTSSCVTPESGSGAGASTRPFARPSGRRGGPGSPPWRGATRRQ